MISRRFTLVELAVVATMALLIGGVAWVSTKDRMPKVRMQRTAKLLKADLELMRSQAIFLSKETRLLFLEGGGCTTGTTKGKWLLQVGNKPLRSDTWDTLPLDMEDDGSDDETWDGEMVLSKGGNRYSRGSCLDDWTLTDDAIVFNNRGMVQNPMADFLSGPLLLTLHNTESPAGVSDQMVITVTKGGTITMGLAAP